VTEPEHVARLEGPFQRQRPRCRRGPPGQPDPYIARFAGERDENGRRLVVRNGYHQPREILTSAGAIEVTVPRVNDKRTDPDTGERKRFSSAIVPPWARKTPKITEVLPLLYLHGLSSGISCPRWASSWAHPPGCRRR
jgi:hypothetical protein